ncbi:hypothetical protein Tco_0718099, partial [Tanacetum coccineum]
VGGRDRIHLIAWEKALRSFDLEAWAGALLPRSVTYLLSSVHEAVKREKGAAI